MFSYKWMILIDFTALPRMLSGKESACNAGDVGLIRKTPRRQNCNPLQYSCLENPMDRGAWWATVHVVTKSWAWRRNSACTHNASLVTFCYPHSVSSVQSLSHVQLFVTPWIAACQASLSIINSRSLLRVMSIESVMPSSHLILCCPLFLLPPIPPSIRVFSNESTLLMRWPKYWSFSFSIIPSKEISGLISFRMDWLDLLAVQGTLKSLLQHHSLKASILQRSAFFTV